MQVVATFRVWVRGLFDAFPQPVQFVKVSDVRKFEPGGPSVRHLEKVHHFSEGGGAVIVHISVTHQTHNTRHTESCQGGIGEKKWRR
jgi:hypothetical protein